MNRRDFIKLGVKTSSVVLIGSQLLPAGCGSDAESDPAASVTDGDLDGAPNDGLTEGEAEENVLSATVYAVLGTELTELPAMATEAAKLLGFTGTALAGATIFIKPNFVALGMELMGMHFDPASGEVTKPELLVAIAEQCLKAGAAKVTIGEGAQTQKWDWATVPFIPGNSIEGATDIKAAVDRLNAVYGDGKAELLCVNEADEWELVPSSSDDKNVKDGINVSRAFALADHVISVPVIKTHQWANMTASMKNLFGLASIKKHGNGISRCNLHMAYADITCHGVEQAGVSGSFIDIFKWRKDSGKQDYAIIDGSICLEGDGPHKAPVNDGKTIHMKDRNAAGKYFLLASTDYVAADATVARIINIPIDDIKALRMARNLALGAIDNVELIGATIDDLKVADWLKPELQPESFFATFCPTGRR